MPTIAENLRNIQSTKLALKASINAKNVGAINDSTPFSAYPNAIDAIQVRTLYMSDSIISDVVEIKDYNGTSFSLKTCIKEFTIPEGVTLINDSCFSGCSSLQNISVTSGVTKIGNFCFKDCSSMTSISIPSGVTSIGSSCFYNCSSLQTVTCNAVTPPTLGSVAFAGCNALASIYVPASSVKAYKSATNWSSYADKIQAIP